MDPFVEAVDELATDLEANATKAALARMVAQVALVRGTMFAGRNVDAVGASVRSELTEHEKIVALMRYGKGAENGGCKREETPGA